MTGVSEPSEIARAQYYDAPPCTPWSDMSSAGLPSAERAVGERAVIDFDRDKEPPIHTPAFLA
jgi:hypothetical protein